MTEAVIIEKPVYITRIHNGLRHEKVKEMFLIVVCQTSILLETLPLCLLHQANES